MQEAVDVVGVDLGTGVPEGAGVAEDGGGGAAEGSEKTSFCNTYFHTRLLFSSLMFHRSSFRLAPTIRQLLSSSSEGSVTVNGWVKSVRRQKNVSFAVISDGSSARGLQVVFGNGDLAKQCVGTVAEAIPAHPNTSPD